MLDPQTISELFIIANQEDADFSDEEVVIPDSPLLKKKIAEDLEEIVNRTRSLTKKKFVIKHVHSNNDDDQLRRFEFFDLLVCIAKTLEFDRLKAHHANFSKREMQVARQLQSLMEVITSKNVFLMRY